MFFRLDPRVLSSSLQGSFRLVVMAWEAIEYFTYLAGLVHYSLLFYMVLVPTTLLLITWLCTSNAREI